MVCDNVGPGCFGDCGVVKAVPGVPSFGEASAVPRIICRAVVSDDTHEVVEERAGVVFKVEVWRQDTGGGAGLGCPEGRFVPREKDRVELSHG